MRATSHHPLSSLCWIRIWITCLTFTDNPISSVSSFQPHYPQHHYHSILGGTNRFPDKKQRSALLIPTSYLYSSPFSSRPPLSILNSTPSSDDDNRISNNDDSWQNKIIQKVTENPKRSLLFSLSQTVSGALLGPFLDSYHSAFGVLQYDHPITRQLWSQSDIPALTTAYWVPPLFGLAGFIIGWLYLLLDEALATETNPKPTPSSYSPPIILAGISFFTLQYWLSGILFAYGVDRTTIFAIMSVCAYGGFVLFDGTKSGLITSLATAIGGPLIEVGLISFLNEYHYTDGGETGFFPLWIVPVYFLGGPANGNLSRGVWDALGGSLSSSVVVEEEMEPCPYCNDTRAVPCPNCDGVGYYVTYGQEVKCNCCNGRGRVICRSCFGRYGDDPSDIEGIRDFMNRLPD